VASLPAGCRKASKALCLLLFYFFLGTVDWPSGRSGVGASPRPGEPRPQVGWFRVPNSKLRSRCPPFGQNYDFPERCQDVIRGWSGGIADTARNRLIIWGGGHNGYPGNEVYAFEVSALKMQRLNEPSPITPCKAATSDGKANSRHTYGALAYIAHADRMFVFGGAWACPEGNVANDTWTLDLATLRWTRMDPTKGSGPRPSMFGAVAAYDLHTRKVILHDRNALWSYDYEQNSYMLLNPDAVNTLHTNAVIDPKRRLFITFGDGRVTAYDIAPGSRYKPRDWSAQVSGCTALANSSSPGLAYDAAQDRIVGWPNFGDTVYIFNPDSKSCTARTFAGGPPDSAHDSSRPSSNGTFGRFQYFPALKVFVVVNDWDIDAHTLRLEGPRTLRSREAEGQAK